jgi:hypothetical protein
MIARPLRRVALPFAVAAGALALSSCASSVNDAATLTYHDSSGTHTVHITRTDLVNDVRDSIGNAEWRKQYTGIKGDSKNTTDARYTALRLTNLIYQAVIDAQFRELNYKMPTDLSKAENATYQLVAGRLQKVDAQGQPDVAQGKAVFAKFPKDLQKRMIADEARTDAVFKWCPSNRLVAHILVKTKAEADQALAAVQADKSQFGAIARAQSIDTGSKVNSGMVGCLAPKEFVPEFQKAAEDAPLNTVVGPVKTQFGYHLIYVTEWDPSLLEQVPDFQQAVTQAVNAKLTARLTDLKVRVEPRYGTWEQVDNGQGGKSYTIVAPKAPAPREQREKS